MDQNLNPGQESVSIELKNVSKHYGETLVLTPFSLTMEAGCRTVLLGPSGCGKTTLLRMIAGLETPDEGSQIWIGGKDVTNIPAEKRQIGFMFQSYALFPNMTVAENVAYGLTVRKEDPQKIKETVARMLELVNLEPYADRPVQALSGGQRQRVALARALAIRPRVLLLDEPLTALDALLRHKVREELAVILKRLGITAVIVTHDQDEAMVLGDKIVVMQGGVIHQADTPQNVWDNPATDFVAGFVGNSNKLKGTLSNGILDIDGGTIAVSDLSPASRERLKGLDQVTVRAFVRPESANIELTAQHYKEPVLRVPVIVRDFHFMGSFIRISVELKSHTKLVKVNMSEIPAGIEPGCEATMIIPAGDLMVFAGSKVEEK